MIIEPGALIGICFIVGVLMGIMLMVYDDGVPFGLYKKLRCKLGKHNFKVGYRKRVNKYFCQTCKAPRKHPALKAIDGGKVEGSTFKF